MPNRPKREKQNSSNKNTQPEEDPATKFMRDVAKINERLRKPG